MSILQSSIVPASAGGYEIANSLRFNDDDSAYLSRTPASAGNRQTWTWSGWVKRGNLGLGVGFMGCGPNNDNQNYIGFSSNDRMYFRSEISNSVDDWQSQALFRDCSAWYHVVAVWESGNATATDRMKVYVNGERLVDTYAQTTPALNANSAIN